MGRRATDLLDLDGPEDPRQAPARGHDLLLPPMWIPGILREASGRGWHVTGHRNFLASPQTALTSGSGATTPNGCRTGRDLFGLASDELSRQPSHARSKMTCCCQVSFRRCDNWPLIDIGRATVPRNNRSGGLGGASGISGDEFPACEAGEIDLVTQHDNLIYRHRHPCTRHQVGRRLVVHPDGEGPAAIAR